MNHAIIAKELAEAKEQIVLIYAFNATGKTRLSVAFKDATKSEDGTHAGVYYNAYSEDLFTWDNDSENGEANVQLDIQKSSLNRFHSSLSEDDIRNKLNRFRPDYRFDFIPHDNPEDGIKSVLFFDEVADPEDPNNISKVARKISRGEERIFVWCFFLALFEVEGWADKQSSHFFIDDPVSSLDDHNIFITASTLFDLIEEHYKERKFVITTHHIGFFSVLSDWLMKGEKASKFKGKARVCTLSSKSGEISLENCRKDVFLYHLRLLQVLEQAHAAGEVKSYHFALLRQVLENVASFLGVGQFGYVLKQIGIEDADEVATIVNTLSHKKVYYFESDEVVPDNLKTFDKIFIGLKEKYNFVLHAPAPALVLAPAPAGTP
ncbi:anticodon nuclease [Pseudomonas umsongensis]|uniref:Anticodon nuclease n=1 Tax=Pseudomonas umsongensis TaxID=198618 RepID=A0ABX4DUH9_9PSED|nr:AAA family ATPase [Pseudomonas umsongensis]OXR31821.1 anticodon nuclease [Pseudomonas umsongensis]SDT71742.1 AAA domain-containing protein [Pseudomonas umsongensis]